MPRFMVRLTKEVIDTLECAIEVEAADEGVAGSAAILLADDIGGWEVSHEGEGGEVSVDSVTEILPAPVPPAELRSIRADMVEAGAALHIDAMRGRVFVVEASDNSLGDVILRCSYEGPHSHPGMSLLFRPNVLLRVEV